MTPHPNVWGGTRGIWARRSKRLPKSPERKRLCAQEESTIIKKISVGGGAHKFGTSPHLEEVKCHSLQSPITGRERGDEATVVRDTRKVETALF